MYINTKNYIFVNTFAPSFARLSEAPAPLPFGDRWHGEMLTSTILIFTIMHT